MTEPCDLDRIEALCAADDAEWRFICRTDLEALAAECRRLRALLHVDELDAVSAARAALGHAEEAGDA